MQIPVLPTQRLAGHVRFVGVVLLLLMYMAQPVLALQDAFCGCAGMADCACASVDVSAESESCCAKTVEPVAAESCCAGGEDGASSGSDSVCHCPVKQVYSTPGAVIFDGQDFEGPFVWWSELEGFAGDWTWLAPNLGGAPGGEKGSALERRAWPPGDGSQARWAECSATQRLLNRGLIAFLADLSVADL